MRSWMLAGALVVAGCGVPTAHVDQADDVQPPTAQELVQCGFPTGEGPNSEPCVEAMHEADEVGRDYDANISNFFASCGGFAGLPAAGLQTIVSSVAFIQCIASKGPSATTSDTSACIADAAAELGIMIAEDVFDIEGIGCIKSALALNWGAFHVELQQASEKLICAPCGSKCQEHTQVCGDDNMSCVDVPPGGMMGPPGPPHVAGRCCINDDQCGAGGRCALGKGADGLPKGVCRPARAIGKGHVSGCHGNDAQDCIYGWNAIVCWLGPCCYAGSCAYSCGQTANAVMAANPSLSPGSDYLGWSCGGASGAECNCVFSDRAAAAMNQSDAPPYDFDQQVAAFGSATWNQYGVSSDHPF